jgi:hypothetical protein
MDCRWQAGCEDSQYLPLGGDQEGARGLGGQEDYWEAINQVLSWSR